MEILYLGITLLTYLLVHNVIPRLFSGTVFYIAASTAWILLSTIMILKARRNNTNILNWRRNNNIIATAIVTASIQIVMFNAVGFFTEFGKNPMVYPTVFTLLITMTLFYSELLAIEFSRAHFLMNTKRKQVITNLAIAAIFFTIISFSPRRYDLSTDTVQLAKFFGAEFIPKLCANIFASFLTILSGPASSIIYMGVIITYEWLVPIQPNPEWFIKTIIYVAVPLTGFLLILMETNQKKLFHLGLIEANELRKRDEKADFGWLAVSFISLLLVWGSAGVFGPSPSVILSGSMTPALQVGDMVITTPVDASKIQVGDVIMYRMENQPVPIIHRVVDISQSGNNWVYITKGDANNVEDDPIVVGSKIDKLVYTIPRLGWASIYLKNAAATAITYITENTYTVALIAATGTLLLAYKAGIHKKILR